MHEKWLSASSLHLWPLVLALACVGCTRRGETAVDTSTRRDTFPVAAPELRDVTITHEYVADVRAARYAEIRSRFRGIIESVSVDEGQEVKAGQVLFTINARARKQDLAVSRAATVAVEAELQAAQLELENTQLLTDKNVVSPAELARANSKVQMLRARLDEAKAAAGRTAVELDRAEIRAPFSGRINRIPFKTGSTIDEHAQLTTIGDTHEMLAYFSVTEREYLELNKAESNTDPRTVRLKLADGSTFAQEGAVDAVDSEIDAATGTIAYRARFANPQGLLKHGSSAKVVLEKKLLAALVVPQKSTFEVQGDVYLYAVDANNMVHARKIIVKERLDDVFVIDSGVGASDRFVLEGIQKIKDGLRIDVRTPTAAVQSAATSTRG